MWGALLLGLWIASPAESEAVPADEPLNVTVTNTLIGEYRTDNKNGDPGDDDYGVLLNRFNLSSSSEHLSAQLRADGFAFIPADDVLFDPAFQDEMLLERISLRAKSKHWVLTGGDFYKQLGRGIALSLRKQDEATVDISLRGGQVEFKSKKHDISVFGGRTNTANLDAVSQRFVEDVDDVIIGGSYTIKPVQWLRVGTYGVFLHPTQALGSLEDGVFKKERPNTRTAGLFVELPEVLEWLSIYVEGDAQQNVRFGEKEEGYAAYLTADLFFFEVGPGDLSFGIEGLYLNKFNETGSQNSALGQDFVYNQPPTLERIDQEVFNNHDVLGGRLYTEYNLLDPEITFYINGVYRLNDPEVDYPNPNIHGYGGVRQSFQKGRSRVELSGGYRDERQGSDAFRDMAHGEFDYQQWLSGPYSVHLLVQQQFWNLYSCINGQCDPSSTFERNTTVLSIEYAGLGSLAYEFGLDNQNTSGEARNTFHAGIASWEINHSFSLQVVGGTRRGGIRCVAGVCRDYPVFAGMQSKLVGRF